MSNGFQLSKEIKVNEDWTVRSESYTEQEIVEGIVDTVDAADIYEITSVPTPYARWHLIDQAFEWVANQTIKEGPSALEGVQIYHKLVAEALDVAEIFFNFEGLRKDGLDLKIKKVRLRDEVARLRKSSDPRHVNLGETYDLFSEIPRGDGVSISIFDAPEINLLYLNEKVIGGTSPISMYFTSADNNRDLAFKFENTTLFKAPHESLMLRSQTFQFAQIGMVKNNPGLERYMPGFCKYINQVADLLKTDLKSTSFSQEALQRAVDTNNSNAVTVLEMSGERVRIYTPKKLDGTLESDLVLGTYDGAFPQGEVKRPLVLSPDYNERKYLFNEVMWNPDKLNTHHAGEPVLEKRNLPGSHHAYPWVTTSDWLEPTIIRVVGPLDTVRFYGNPGHRHGSVLQDEKGDYLIPVKPLFFKYFSREDLFGTIDNRPVLEMNRVDDDKNIEVVLRIPIGKSSKDFVEFRRRYELNAHVDEARNEGSVKKLTFNLGLIPDVAAPIYERGQVVVQEARTDRYLVTLRMAASWEQEKGENVVYTNLAKNDPVVRVDPKDYDNDGTTLYRPQGRFDMIQVIAGPTAGWLLMKQIRNKVVSTSAKFDIAVDFGTTNTHVALRDRSLTRSQYEPFGLNNPSLSLRTLFPYDYMPPLPQLRTNLLLRSFFHEIGDRKKYSFPIRTAIAETTPDDDPEVIPVGRMNIPFYYQEMATTPQDSIYTGLKWSNIAQPVERSRLHHFFGCILQLVANEIVLRGGTLQDVRLVFFYPSAMSISRRNDLSNGWKAAYETYFGSSVGSVHALSESVAPYEFFTIGASSHVNGTNVINCDIGGGTCDAYIKYRGAAEDAKIASFQFGGNAVFGDGYDRDNEARNGFVRQCRDAVENKVAANQSSKDAFYELSRAHSEEMISFFLSLSNKELHEGVNFDFQEFIKTNRPQLQLIYLLYFGSIVYHLAQVTKAMGLEAPTYLSFTGNGSKIIKSLATDEVLGKIGGFIIAGVYNGMPQEDSYKGLRPLPLTIKTHEEPKEFTCKGGLALLSDLPEGALNTRFTSPANVVLLGNVKSPGTSEEDKVKDVFFIEGLGEFVGKSPQNYRELYADRTFRQGIKENIANMVDILLEIDRAIGFGSLFDVNIQNRAALRAEILSHVELGLIDGLEEIMKSSNDDQMPDETLFFLPLRAVLYKLGMTINQTNF